MNMVVRIVSKSGAPMSKYHSATPKVINGMKEQADKLAKMFGEEYKVQRYMLTSKGPKRI